MLRLIRTSSDAMRADRRHKANDTGRDRTSGYGEWTDFQVPDDRSGWHPHCRAFYDYWLRISPAGRFPGRRHVSPFESVSLLPRMRTLDVVRDPLRFRYRLVATGEVRTLALSLAFYDSGQLVPL
jgi:hypothetical protein